MMKRGLQLIWITMALFVVSLVLPGCVHHHPRHHPRKGPPAHAPAHGYRAKHGGPFVYFYYPTFGIYYSPARDIYFWNHGGHWKSGGHPPHKLGNHKRVRVKVKSRKPYTHHRKIKGKYGGPKGKGKVQGGRKRGSGRKRGGRGARKGKDRDKSRGKSRGQNRGNDGRKGGKGKTNGKGGDKDKGEKEKKGKGKGRGKGR